MPAKNRAAIVPSVFPHSWDRQRPSALPGPNLSFRSYSPKETLHRDILVPEFRLRRDEVAHELDAFLVLQHLELRAGLAQPKKEMRNGNGVRPCGLPDRSRAGLPRRAKPRRSEEEEIYFLANWQFFVGDHALRGGWEVPTAHPRTQNPAHNDNPPLSNVRACGVLSVVAILLFNATANGQIFANFGEGNGTASVNQYQGIAGNGWTTPWSTNTSGTNNLASGGFTGTVTNANPLMAAGTISAPR